MDNIGIIKEVGKLFGATELPSEIKDFVPYFYLDGHRTGAARFGLSHEQGYVNGVEFFYKMVALAASLGITDCVAMIHTKRNQKSRIDEVTAAISNSTELILNNIAKYGHKFYGDLTEQTQLHAACTFLEMMEQEKELRCHLLINYSEEWAIHNFERLNSIPNISSTVRFTKGYISGGSIPTKMDNSLFVYAQNPSIAISWSDEQIFCLLLIQFFNWLNMRSYIGSKEYLENESKTIAKSREEELDIQSHDLSNMTNPIEKKMILTFNETGIVRYVI